MVRRRTRAWTVLALSITMACALGSCGWGHQRRAPVVDWGKTKAKASSPAVPAAEQAVATAVSGTDPATAQVPPPDPPPKRPPFGVENAGKPGYYTVQKGDTLIRIGLDAGQNYRDIARWNGIENPNKIEIGDVYRVVPPEEPVVAKPVASVRLNASPLPPVPAAAPAASKTPPPAALPAASSAPVVTSAVASVPVKPVPATGVSTPPEPAGTVLPAARSVAAAPAPAPASGSASGTASVADEAMEFAWPAKGEVIAGFDETKNRKGLDLAGGAGDPVLAAAEGKVVYAGDGLRGYGKLIIIKHNNLFLTAYAHNQTILVKEDQSVKKGQKIAEMGSTDSDRVKLHFEVRRLGRPVDPLKYLGSR